MVTGYEARAYNDINTIAGELTAIRKLLKRLVDHVEKADAEPEAEDLDVRGPE